MGRKSSSERAAEEAVRKWKRKKIPLDCAIRALLKQAEVAEALKEADLDYYGSLQICKSIRETLQKIRYQERYSGVRKAILAASSSGVSQRKVGQLLQTSRAAVASAQAWQRSWASDPAAGSICQSTKLVRCRTNEMLPEFIKQWIIDNTTPSSNTKNTIKVITDGVPTDHVVHWTLETIESMFQRCKLEVAARFGSVFEKTYFYYCIPSFVRPKRKQDGLCPQHHTGISLEKEFVRKRTYWHRRCTCLCPFCDPDGCNHGCRPAGGRCSLFTCARCSTQPCPLELSVARTNWLRPVQKKRDGGGLTWTNEVYNASRSTMLATMKKEMEMYLTHSNHVIHHKTQMRLLLDNLLEDHVTIKCDFIQNIVHERGRETSQSYYGKRQTQLLSFVIWYFVPIDGVMVKHKMYIDYLSSYLKHNSVFFQKCLIHLLTYLRDDVGVQFRKVWLDSDGGKAHFKCRISFYFASTLPDLFGISLHWIFAPSNHGKGDCDSHGAVVKKGIRMFCLNDEQHVDDEEEAVTFINSQVRNTTAFLMPMGNMETEQDCTGVLGSSKMHEFRFAGKEGTVSVRQYPCFCDPCMEEDYSPCQNAGYVGEFFARTMQKTGLRVATSRFINPPAHPVSTSEFIPKSILGSRLYEGQHQYEVEWEGYEETTWHDADKLFCIDLIEEYEINKE